MLKPFDAIFCIDLDRGIGKNGRIPWKVKKDMDFFKRMTLNQVVVMGRFTWDFLPKRPLPHRINFVVSKGNPSAIKNNYESESPVVCSSFDLAYSKAVELHAEKSIFMIGGAMLMKTAFEHEAFRFLYLTQLDLHSACDANLDPFEDKMEFEELIEEGVDETSAVRYSIKKYKKR